MATAWTQKEVDQLYDKVMKKAAVDAVFRKKLLTNTNKTLSEFSGKEIPAALKIKVIENDPKYQKTFVLPDLVSEEISDKDLEKVAGGASGLIGVSACAVAISIGPCPADACAVALNLK